MSKLTYFSVYYLVTKNFLKTFLEHLTLIVNIACVRLLFFYRLD